MTLLRDLRAALSLLLLMTLLLGFAYPLLVTGLGALAFPRQTAGSLVYRNQTLAGSRLIGQHFAAAQYFWSRPSATSPQPNNALASGASNLGPLNPALLQAVDLNRAALETSGAALEAKGAALPATASAHPAIPVDLVTASASGLDPDISIAAAHYQSPRIAQARKIPQSQVDLLIARLQRTPLFGIIGEPHVNVLELNLALDQIHE